MFESVGRTLHAAVNLLEVRARIVLKRAERVAAAAVWRVAGIASLGLAAMVGLSAAAIALAPEWGWPAVLAAIAAVFAIVGAGAWGISASLRRPEAVADPAVEALENEAAYWGRVLSPPPEVKEAQRATAHRPSVEHGVESLEKMLKDPAMIASAVFAVAAILGPFRALRTAAKVAAATSAVRKVARTLKDSGVVGGGSTRV
jgi:hypothetical protein